MRKFRFVFLFCWFFVWLAWIFRRIRIMGWIFRLIPTLTIGELFHHPSPYRMEILWFVGWVSNRTFQGLGFLHNYSIQTGLKREQNSRWIHIFTMINGIHHPSLYPMVIFWSVGWVKDRTVQSLGFLQRYFRALQENLNWKISTWFPQWLMKRRKLITTLFQGQSSQAQNTLIWKGTNYQGKKCSSGIYFCVLECGTKRKCLKLISLN